MIGHSEFARLSAEAAIDADAFEILEAWGIDADAMLQWIHAAVDALKDQDDGEDERLKTALLGGFEMGYKAAREVETQRVAELGPDRF